MVICVDCLSKAQISVTSSTQTSRENPMANDYAYGEYLEYENDCVWSRGYAGGYENPQLI